MTVFFCLAVFSALDGWGQGDVPILGNRLGNLGRGGGGRISGNTGGKPDSLRRRTGLEDSLTIYFRRLDSARIFRLDSNINDYSRRFPIPPEHAFIGNLGSATRSLIFSPTLKAGFDPGFHAFDVYRMKVEDANFYNTTRPYSEMGYTLGSKTEQMIHLLHTQNIRPNWNFAMQYRLINAPGHFKSQRNNHNLYHFSSWYQGRKKRYNAYLVMTQNKLEASENGGIKNETQLDSAIYKDRFLIGTNLGGDPRFARNFFASNSTIGNFYDDFSFLIRQQYDIGKKDSLVRDSNTYYLFYPKLRVQHTFRYNKNLIRYSDTSPDTAFYKYNYSFLATPSSILLEDQWKEIVNELAVYQYPDTKNSLQYFMAGASLHNITGYLDAGKYQFYNIRTFAEYRNKTRNQKWDIEARGELYPAGLNSGDYSAYVSLQRYLNKKWGYLKAGFQNVNRTPSFHFDGRSSFTYWTGTFSKENYTHVFGLVNNPANKLQLAGHYWLIGNYTYFINTIQPQQDSKVFNLLQIELSKEFRFRRYWHLYTQVMVQPTTANAPVNLPLVYTRNRIAFEGIFFKNLNLATGLEIRYHTPFKADGYSPLNGQFYLQNFRTISNLPDIAAFMHFRIRGFNLFFRAENLNTASLKDGFAFINNNMAAPAYPYPGFLIRVGILWRFVN